MGIHPHETKSHVNIDKKMLLKLRANNKKIIGIGETGLDFFYKNSNELVQKEKFIEHIISSLTEQRANEEKKYLDAFETDKKFEGFLDAGLKNYV